MWLARKLVKQGRRVVVDGIRDLAIDHVQVDEAWVRQWPEHVQPNDVVIIDEVQRYWPPVSVSTKPTEDIEKLHVHRHFGVDFILITQHPQRMNKTIRDLVGRHVHVRRMLGMNKALLYEWDSTRNPNGSLKDAVKTWWAYPKDVFKLYTSAELHTKPKAVVPKVLFVIPVALVALVVCVWLGYRSVVGMGTKSNGAAVPSPAAAGPTSAPVEVRSDGWRLVGAYAIDGMPYVLLADAAGRVRSVPREGFRGEGLRLEGAVDGVQVAVWTGVEQPAKMLGGTGK
ncbi:zonular occludens toxin domain-containing protein [Trinickia fusca]|uniref:zonular occludens toxin domain-containing protein n=1 Tax=Trinickia fusca TaxID=2419777 RepID=UPI003CCC6F15